MAKITALSCPNCNAFISRDQNKCKYCGAELIISPDGSSFSFRSQSKCPKCGAINEASSWICVNCKTILTKDVDMLKELQKKWKFQQETLKSCMAPWIGEKLEPDEFIYFVYHWQPKGANKFYAVTDKRIIKSKKPYGKYEEALLSEVIAIGDARFKPGVFSGSFYFEVETLHGNIVFDEISQVDAIAVGRLIGWMREALHNYNYRKKNIKALIISLPLE